MDVSSLIARFGSGQRMSLAVTHNGTGYFAVTPKAPYDGALSLAEQARQLFEKADARLAEIGSSKEKLLFVAVMLAEMDGVAEFNAEWDRWVEGIAPPARACFGAALANPALKLELIMIAACDEPANHAG